MTEIAVIFQRAMSVPKQAAAVSSRRIASRFKPIQDRSRRRVNVKASTNNARAATT